MTKKRGKKPRFELDLNQNPAGLTANIERFKQEMDEFVKKRRHEIVEERWREFKITEWIKANPQAMDALLKGEAAVYKIMEGDDMMFMRLNAARLDKPVGK